MHKFTKIILTCLVAGTAITSASAAYQMTDKTDAEAVTAFAETSAAATATSAEALKNVQYSENAAVFTMTEEPNDTVTTKTITLSGSVDQKGSITITQNDKTIVNGLSKAANESFTQSFTLQYGRNSIEIYHTNGTGAVSRQSYNIVYLADYDIVVDSSFTGTAGSEVNGFNYYSTVQEAVNSVSKNNKESVVIFVKNGVYKEKVTIEKPYVNIIGEDSEKTVITYGDANATPKPDGTGTWGTGGSASVTIKNKATHFTAENITFENSFVEGTYGGNGEQAVAVNNQADQSMFVNCRFIGNQDTLLTEAPGVKLASEADLPTLGASNKTRQYYYKCYIEGDVDFIFGRAQAGFEDCDIVSLDRGSKNNNGYVTAASTWDEFKYGYIFLNSRLLGEEGIAASSVSLGRPWHPSNYLHANARVAYINTYMGAHISAKGWDDMSGFKASDADFYEYGSYGPGSKTSSTRPVLTSTEAAAYTMKNLFSDNYDSAWNHTADLTEMYKDINVAPTFTLTSDIPAETTESALLLQGSLDLPGTLAITLNGKNIVDGASYAADQTISQQLTLAEGLNTIKVTAKDASNRQSEKTYTVTYTKVWSKEELFTISGVKLTDFTGKTVTDIQSNMTIVADVNVTNNSSLAQEGTITIGLFDAEGKMISSASVSDAYKGKAAASASATFNIPEGTGYSIKAFME